MKSECLSKWEIEALVIMDIAKNVILVEDIKLLEELAK